MKEAAKGERKGREKGLRKKGIAEYKWKEVQLRSEKIDLERENVEIYRKRKIITVKDRREI